MPKMMIRVWIAFVGLIPIPSWTPLRNAHTKRKPMIKQLTPTRKISTAAAIKLAGRPIRFSPPLAMSRSEAACATIGE
jgi:hypothetical protein